MSNIRPRSDVPPYCPNYSPLCRCTLRGRVIFRQECHPVNVHVLLYCPRYTLCVKFPRDKLSSTFPLTPRAYGWLAQGQLRHAYAG